MNFLAQIVEKKAALLTDSRPSFSVTSRKQEQDPLCPLLENVIGGILDEIDFEQKMTELVFFDEYFGSGFTNTCFDTALDGGRGDINLVGIDPRCFIFDPFVVRSYNLRSAEYLCLETIRPTDMLKEGYRSRRDDITNDFAQTEVKGDSLIAKLRLLFGFDKDNPNTKTSVIPRSIVRDWWVRDRTTRKGEELVFPNYRHIFVAGGVPVEDGDGVYVDGGHPFDMMEWGFNVDSAYGLNEVDQLTSPQIVFNKLLASMVENAILMGNGIWIGDKDALTKEEWEKLSNEPGQHVKVRTGRQLRREPGIALPSSLNGVLTMLVQGLEKLSGITEVTEGRRPGQVTSGVAIESLAIMAQTSIRLRARQIEALLTRIGPKLISRIFQYYTTDRVFQRVGKGKYGGIESYTYHRQLVREAIEAKKGNMSEALRDYTFRVQPASSLAMTKWQKGLIATQLFQMGAIDREALLEAMEYPNRDVILSRTMEKQATGEEMTGTSKGTRIPQSMLRGGHKETGLQYPQKNV
jgi:hypothetical protein